MAIIYNSTTLGQPQQAISTNKKDLNWKKENLDWIEGLLTTHLPEKQRRLIKNYNIAQGVIDINDYIDKEDFNQVFDVVETALEENLLSDSSLVENDLNFYPIVPTIINVLSGELLKKFDHIKVKAIDEYSINDFIEQKKKLIIEYIKQKSAAEIQEKLKQTKLSKEEYNQSFNEELDKAMNLPQIQKFMQRNYKSNYEEWANRILEQAESKYKIKELELELFKHQLIGDEAYTEIKINGDDLDLINWNPTETLVIKPNHIKYVSDADLVARQYYTTMHDVLTKYKNKLKASYVEEYDNGTHRGTLSDRKLAPDDNESLGINEKKLLAFSWLTDNSDINYNSEVLVTEAYWMSRRKLAKLTAIYDGVKIEKIVDDTFKVTIKPQYNKEKELIAGEVLEYFYSPQVWRGTKLNFSKLGNIGIHGEENEYLDKEIFGKESKKEDDESEAYIDIEPLEYQFTDSINPFKPKIPIAGCDGFEPNMNVGKLSLIDKTKAFQVLYNGFLNEIDKFAKTEIGLFYIMDQKLIPQKSLDGSWGKYNWLKFVMTAKDTGLGLVDNSSSNIEGSSVMQQPTVVNLLKNPQFQSRIELANYCEQQILKIIGISPQRIGNISSQETATGINQAINNSYSQTEMYYFNHTNLMKELKTLLLDAEKYIESKKPISRVQYLNSNEENIMFELDTEDLLIRRFNIFLTSNTDSARALEQLRQIAIQDNTSGSTLLDKAIILESNNLRTIKDQLAKSIDNLNKQQEIQRNHEQEMLNKQLAEKQQSEKLQKEFIASENEKDRIKDMYVADVKAVGFSQNQDIDNSGINDALEVQRFNLEQDKNYADIIDSEFNRNIKEKELTSKMQLQKQALSLKEEEMRQKERIKMLEINRDLANMKNDEKIAQINKQNKG